MVLYVTRVANQMASWNKRIYSGVSWWVHFQHVGLSQLENKPGIVAYACSPSTQEVKEGMLWVWVWGHSRLYSQTLRKPKTTNENARCFSQSSLEEQDQRDESMCVYVCQNLMNHFNIVTTAESHLRAETLSPWSWHLQQWEESYHRHLLLGVAHQCLLRQ